MFVAALLGIAIGLGISKLFGASLTSALSMILAGMLAVVCMWVVHEIHEWLL